MNGWKPQGVIALLLVACAERPGSASGAADTAAATVDSIAGWAVGVRGAGPIRYGMSVADARRATGDSLAGAPGDATCGYAAAASTPAGMSLMVEGGNVVRVDVDSAGIPTDRGAVVGMTEAHVRRLYPDSIESMPHKYDTAGGYLIVVPTEPADTALRIVFELDGGGRVVRYRAGLRPAVEYVERCG